MKVIEVLIIFCLLQLPYVTSKDIVCRQEDIMEGILKNKPKFKSEINKRKQNEDVINTPRSLLQNLTNCTVYHGNLSIIHKDADKKFEEDVRYQDLVNLNKLRIIYGYVFLMLEKYPEVRNLSFLSSLRMIQTSDTNARGFVLILSLVEMINFTNVRLNVPYIGIGSNKHLCYLENFQTINSSVKMDIANNKDPKKCLTEGRVCSRSCSPKKGCWGPKERHCFECRRWKAGDHCVYKCESRRGFFTPPTGRICGRCHKKCTFGCFGRRRTQCHSRPEVVEWCRKDMYFDLATGRCAECSSSCFGDGLVNRSRVIVRACTGPGNSTGPDGCTSGCPAATFLTVSSDGLLKCLPCLTACVAGCGNASLSGCRQSPKIYSRVQVGAALSSSITMPLFVFILGAVGLIFVSIGGWSVVKCAALSISNRRMDIAKQKIRKNEMNIEREYGV